MKKEKILWMIILIIVKVIKRLMLLYREVKKKIENKGNVKEKKNWWKLAKNFVDMYNFISTARKYTKYATEYRNGFIAERFKEIGSEIEALKEWIISIEKPFWEEFEIFEDLDLSFKNIDSKMKIQKQKQYVKIV